MKIAIYGNSHQDNRIGVIDKMFSSLAVILFKRLFALRAWAVCTPGGCLGSA